MTSILCVKCGCFIREDPPFEDRLRLYSTCWDCARKAKTERDRKNDEKFRREKTKPDWSISHVKDHRVGWVFWKGG